MLSTPGPHPYGIIEEFLFTDIKGVTCKYTSLEFATSFPSSVKIELSDFLATFKLSCDLQRCIGRMQACPKVANFFREDLLDQMVCFLSIDQTALDPVLNNHVVDFF